MYPSKDMSKLLNNKDEAQIVNNMQISHAEVYRSYHPLSTWKIKNTLHSAKDKNKIKIMLKHTTYKLKETEEANKEKQTREDLNKENEKIPTWNLNELHLGLLGDSCFSYLYEN